MAQAFRSDKFGSDHWKNEVKFLVEGGAATLPNQCCSACHAEYTVLVKVGDDQDYCLDRFKNHLTKECPKHGEHYRICESRVPREEVVGESY
jgi:hypothetical protein